MTESNLISMVKPIRCINVSNLFHSWNGTLHISDGLSVRHQEFKIVHTTTGICQTDTAVCLRSRDTTLHRHKGPCVKTVRMKTYYAFS